MKISTHFSLSAILALFCLPALLLTAAEKPVVEDRWEKNIRAFEKRDEQSPPEKGGILFVGSSSVTKWDTKKGFPDLNVINRGFGGTQISDQLKYMDRIVWKYEPKIVVFYCGDNDIAAKKTTERVLADFETFRTRLAEKLPETKLVYLPIKPSIKRWNLWESMQKVNQAIEKASQTTPNLFYCDTASGILGENGEPRPEVFVKDGLHLSEQGYAEWNRIVRAQIEALQ